MQKKIFIFTQKAKGLREHCSSPAFHLRFKREKFPEASIEVLFFNKEYQRVLEGQVCVYLKGGEKGKALYQEEEAVFSEVGGGGGRCVLESVTGISRSQTPTPTRITPPCSCCLETK